MADKIEKYVIQVVRPSGIDEEEMMAHIEEAVDSWGKQLHPSNPLFNDNECSVLRATPHRLIRMAQQMKDDFKAETGE